MFGGLKTPDITQAQILSALTWFAGQAVAIGLVDNDTAQWVLQLTTTALTAGWVLADSVIRHGRAKAVAAASIAEAAKAGLKVAS